MFPDEFKSESLLKKRQIELVQYKRAKQRHQRNDDSDGEEYLCEWMYPPIKDVLWNDYDRDTSTTLLSHLINNTSPQLLSRTTTVVGKKEELSSDPRIPIYQYGMEIRHIPLFRYLQHSSKYTNTSTWLLARRELKFSKCFDRIAELKLARQWGPSSLIASKLSLQGNNTSIRKQCNINTHWDKVLNELFTIHHDMQMERNWKLVAACQLAYEAQAHHFQRRNLSRFPTPNTSDDFMRGLVEGMFCEPGRELFFDRMEVEKQLAIKVQNNEHEVSFTERDVVSLMMKHKQHSTDRLILTPPPERERKGNNNGGKEGRGRKASLPSMTLLKSELRYIAQHPKYSASLLAHCLNITFHSSQQIRHESDIKTLLDHIPQLQEVFIGDEMVGKRELMELHARRVEKMKGKDSKLVIKPVIPPSTIKRISTKKEKDGKEKEATASESAAEKTKSSNVRETHNPLIESLPTKELNELTKEQPAETPTIRNSITFNVHPSHETALRKANLNITKMLTPSELALKRVQRTGVGYGILQQQGNSIASLGGMNVGTIGGGSPAVNVSTTVISPTPNNSNTTEGGAPSQTSNTSTAPVATSGVSPIIRQGIGMNTNNPMTNTTNGRPAAAFHPGIFRQPPPSIPKLRPPGQPQVSTGLQGVNLQSLSLQQIQQLLLQIQQQQHQLTILLLQQQQGKNVQINVNQVTTQLQQLQTFQQRLQMHYVNKQLTTQQQRPSGQGQTIQPSNVGLQRQGSNPTMSTQGSTQQEQLRGSEAHSRAQQVTTYLRGQSPSSQTQSNANDTKQSPPRGDVGQNNANQFRDK